MSLTRIEKETRVLVSIYTAHICTHQCMPSTLLALRTINSRETASFMSFDKRTQQFTPFLQLTPQFRLHRISKTAYCSGRERECASIMGGNPGIIYQQICQPTSTV
jgi:hypothetical protein